MEHRAGDAASRVRASRIDRVLGWCERGAIRRVVALALPFGLVASVVLGVWGLWDWSHVHGRPVEHARLTASEAVGQTERCGKHSSAQVRELTWVSEDPPPGLPAEFQQRAGCDAASEGDAAEVVRVVQPDGSVRVWVDPITTPAEVGGAFVAGLLIGWALGILVIGFFVLRDGSRNAEPGPTDAAGFHADVEPAAVVSAAVDRLDDRLTPSDRAALSLLEPSASSRELLEELISRLVASDVRLDDTEAGLLGAAAARVKLSGRAARDAALLVQRC